MRAIIIDDEADGIVALTKQLEWCCPEVKVIASSTKPTEGLMLLLEMSFDVLFLDIEMPELNGFELLARLGHREFEVVFVTAYDAYAIKAFNTHATAYLLKPVEEDLLVETVNRISNRMKSKKDKDVLHDLLEFITHKTNTRIALPNADGMDFVQTDQIVRLESDGNYTHVYLANLEKLFVSKNLKYICKKLPENQFVRPHHSHVVNISYIAKYIRGSGGQIILDDRTVIPVSRTRKSDFMKLF